MVIIAPGHHNLHVYTSVCHAVDMSAALASEMSDQIVINVHVIMLVHKVVVSNFAEYA